MPANAIRPYRIEIPQSDLDDLHDRLARTRWTDAAPGDEDGYGVGLGYVRRLPPFGGDFRSIRRFADETTTASRSGTRTTHPAVITPLTWSRSR